MTCCPCDRAVHPPKPDVPAGLAKLTRQLAGFPEYRLAMLGELREHPALREWRAREGDDLGLMLLEMWAYVLDVVGFYDERLADESYLRTAVLGPSLRKLVELVGYRPRPALGASVVLAAVADGPRPVELPAGTAFRSEAFDDEPPQVFETEVAAVLDPKRNRWTLGPVRSPLADGSGEILLDAGTGQLTRGQLALLRWSGGLAAGKVTDVEAVEGLDGATYLRPTVVPAPDLDTGVELADVEVLSPSLTASPNPFREDPVTQGGLRTRIVLDGLYRQIVRRSLVIVERGDQLHPTRVRGVEKVDVEVGEAPAFGGEAPTVPVTRIRVRPKLPASWIGDPSRLVIHFHMVDGGRLTRVAETRLLKEHLEGAALEGPVEPFETPLPGELLLEDADERGLRIGGSVDVTPAGRGTLTPAQDTPDLVRPLRAPVKVYGNLVAASRGESVPNEVLGSGDGSQAFQSFVLAKKPLTYFNDPAAPGGRRSTLEVRVQGLRWSEVPSFFGAGPDDRIYVVRRNDDGESAVTFGDGVRGARLPTGVDNVVATYRFGAGAAKPPAGTLRQLARPFKGLRRVVNPVAAGGGADADRPEDLRRNAPRSSLTLGRAVSLADFEALAHEFGGVVQARAAWAWDDACQRAVVKVWFISDGGDIRDDLRAFLIGQAAPETPLVAAEATPLPSKLVIDLVVGEGHGSDRVEMAVAEALADPEGGLLALDNVPIGCPLFRSRLFEQVLSVEGAASVRAMTLDGKPVPDVLTTPEGRFRSFLGGLVVGNTDAGDVLFAQVASLQSASLQSASLQSAGG